MYNATIHLGNATGTVLRGRGKNKARAELDQQIRAQSLGGLAASSTSFLAADATASPHGP